MNDPIYHFNITNKDVVSRFVIEPLPDIYEKLVKNYKLFPKIKPVNIAIHTSQREMIMHRVKPEREAEVPDLAR